MKTRDTGDSLVVETSGGFACRVCGAVGLDAEHVAHRLGMACYGYKLPPRVPPPNLQRFEPAGRGPCGFCGGAALLDKATGLCCACARVWILGRP